jgi:hypothetical protein
MSASPLHRGAPPREAPPSKDFYRLYTDKSCIKRICDIVISILRDILYLLMIPYLRCTSKSLYARYSDPLWKENSAGLVVLVHGLNGDPSIWRTHVKLFKQNPKLDIYVPKVLKKGNCSLESAVADIFAKTFDYIKKNTGKKVCLIGFSNGGRIVFKIDADLRSNSAETVLKVSTVAAPLLGTSFVDRMNRSCCLRRLLDTALQDELSFESDFSQTLVNSVTASLPAHASKRHYTLYASTNDPIVSSLRSSLPILNLGETYSVVHGYGHKSIVDRVAKEQVEECISWFKIQ